MGKRIQGVNEIKHNAIERLRGIPKRDNQRFFQKNQERRRTCMDLEGAYFLEEIECSQHYLIKMYIFNI